MLIPKKTKWIYLSYPVDNNTPAYAGADDAVSINPQKEIAKGDSCNTSKWELSNHLGTHIDFPRHFVKDGYTVDNYPPHFFIFKRIGFLSIWPIKDGALLSRQHINIEDLPKDIDFLIIKTGFCEKRRQTIYWKENPGFSPDFANYLRQYFTKLRVMGFDSISLSSLMHRKIGREAHKVFLDHRRPILPLEDMDLTIINGNVQFKQIIIAPWRVRNADAVPCTVMAEVYE